MKKELKDIILGVGLGNLKFGISREEAKKILGEPSEVEEYSYSETEEDLTESWHYDELELSLGFDEEDEWRLVTLSISAEDVQFQNEKVMGLKKEELLALLEKANVDDVEIEDWSTDENPGHELIFSDNNGISFWFEESVLVEIQWSPLINEEDEVVWP